MDHYHICAFKSYWLVSWVGQGISQPVRSQSTVVLCLLLNTVGACTALYLYVEFGSPTFNFLLCEGRLRVYEMTTRDICKGRLILGILTT